MLHRWSRARASRPVDSECATAACHCHPADAPMSCFTILSSSCRLLQVRAAELLRRADAVIYDDLGAAAAVEQYAASTAQRIYVGKRGGQPSIKQPEINSILVRQATVEPGRLVVRLKGGCPSVFSRVRRAGCMHLTVAE